MSKQFSKRSRIHSPYFTRDGRRVSGVTTVLNIIAKPALIHWAWDLGIKGIDYNTYRDELADVGTLAHDMILCHIQKQKVDTSEYSQRNISLAENSFLSYLEWERQHKVEPFMMEKKMVSEVYEFGGKPDFIGYVDYKFTLLDFKTGKGIYDNFWYQIAGYNILAKECLGISYLDQFMILNIGRSENEKFVQQKKTDISLDTKIFMAALDIYQTKKQIKKQ